MADDASGAAWFARTGLPLSARELAALDAIRRGDALLARAEPGSVAHWYEAGAIVRAADRDSRWWDHEEEERERLWECAAERHGEDALAAAFAAIGADLRDAIRAGAAVAMARLGAADPELAREAVSAALLAAHQRSLARLAGEGDGHYFCAKYQLFAGGRWPLGLHDGRYWVF
jgi:hypothetical protein